MKIAGQNVERVTEEVVVFPRQGKDLIIKAKAITDYAAFDSLCPTPEPPEILKPGPIRVKNVEDPSYKKALDDWGEKRTSWMIIKSLEATEDLVWDTVDLSDSETWINVQKELSECFSTLEVTKILEIVITANGLNQDKIDQATAAFLAGVEAQ